MVNSIMADPKKGDMLPRGAITYLENWYYEQMTGNQIFQGNRYTKKGWQVEDAAIDDYAKLNGYELTGKNKLVKNEEFFCNDFTEGTPDVLVGTDLVVDIKSPWAMKTFSKYADYVPTKGRPCPNANYFWQLQAYMLVADRERAELAYVLMNTPKELIAPEKGDVWEDYEKNLSLKKRVKMFAVPRSNSHICRIEERVKICRDYLNEIIIPANS